MTPKTLVGTLVSTLFFSPLWAQEISVADLGKLTLSFTSVNQVQQIEAAPVPAILAAQPGSSFYLTAPETIQQRRWLVAEGEWVDEGQALVQLKGAEIAHFQLQFAAAEAAFKLAKQRYDRNQKLRANGAIGAETWSQISRQYFDTLLQYEHLQHFSELLKPGDNPETLILHAPMAGLLQYGDSSEPLMSGAPLLGILPADELRLKLRLPLAQKDSVNAVMAGECQLQISRKDQLAKRGFVDTWSQAVPPSCGLQPGQQLQVIPLQAINALVVPKQSLYSWGTGSQVLSHSQNKLRPTDVQVIGASADSYFLAPNETLVDAEVLSDSVAAVKGILLGLGGE
ncbi:hypothetical protein [Shewanella algae]|uniref:hypothetical protein n=1 Tax=Shewanella algae TaxID=38313 RepID=UPI000BB5EB48|nr:hypothetical protein [Shewanella algae]PBQ26710.1 hypothetical protein AYI97_13940 [Shewanella algae]